MPSPGFYSPGGYEAEELCERMSEHGGERNHGDGAPTTSTTPDERVQVRARRGGR